MRALVTRYPVGATVGGEDLDFCMALFAFHPDFDAKFRSGLRRLEVQLDSYANKHFQIYRLDGTDDDISWTWCVRHAS